MIRQKLRRNDGCRTSAPRRSACVRHRDRSTPALINLRSELAARASADFDRVPEQCHFPRNINCRSPARSNTIPWTKDWSRPRSADAFVRTRQWRCRPPRRTAQTWPDSAIRCARSDDPVNLEAADNRGVLPGGDGPCCCVCIFRSRIWRRSASRGHRIRCGRRRSVYSS